MPLVGFLGSRSPDCDAYLMAAFLKGKVGVASPGPSLAWRRAERSPPAPQSLGFVRDARLRSRAVIRQDAEMSQLTESYILSVAESAASGQPATRDFHRPERAHGHRFGNGGRPARAWSADRAGGHLSDDVLSFRMNKAQAGAIAISPCPPILLCFALHRWRCSAAGFLLLIQSREGRSDKAN
jgi:hypothetical protein